MPKVSLCVYKQVSGRIGSVFGVSCWFKLTCQVVCYKVVPGRMGQRGNVQGMKPSKTMRSVFALNFMWPRLEDVQSNDRRAQENASS